ncbi:alkaline phosphatase PhoX [Nostoc sp. 106C]|uniref:alkaline phosphatase PhoX n=1 Tax=Nostoc sp. 106C TaxID=1932667 RepID=UPI000B69C744|nr:alkaline phosphatase PhoX [Nostoc sp. 106C]OUL26613.1 phosphatase [Nostoc sp. 106C]
MSLSRRHFFKLAGASAIGVSMVSPLEALYARAANGQVAGGIGYGPLEPKLPENADELVGVVLDGINLGTQPLLELPPGFNYTAISYTGQKMDDGALVGGNHDGMAAFAGPKNTTILVRNHEVSANGSNPIVGLPRYDQIGGGTTTIIVGPNRRVKQHSVSLAGTIRNCAGGPTPWGSWISCEENLTLPGTGGATKKHGYNFEVPATADIQVAAPIPLVAMGRFNHEAVAVDPDTGYIYQTEDDGGSCFYRFRPNVRPNKYGDLQERGGGVLEALVLDIPGRPSPVNTRTNFLQYKNQPLSVRWVQIDNVDPDNNNFASSVRGQGQAKGAAIFSRGEGCWYGNGLVYFTCTNGGNIGQGQVFAYDPKKNTLTLVVESTDIEKLNFPDNITVAPFGDLFLCEDGEGTEYVHGVNKNGELYRFATNAINGSEFAGACFSPDGHTMFVNIQTPGITCAIWGPWTRKRA